MPGGAAALAGRRPGLPRDGEAKVVGGTKRARRRDAHAAGRCCRVNDDRSLTHLLSRSHIGEGDTTPRIVRANVKFLSANRRFAPFACSAYPYRSARRTRNIHGGEKMADAEARYDALARERGRAARARKGSTEGRGGEGGKNR